MTEAVAKKKETAVANIMEQFEAHAGAGMDSIGTEDMQIPFLRILQPLSPQLLKTDPKFIKGASAGDLFNTVTGQVWDPEEGVVVIPCGYTTKYLEFSFREEGGGFVQELNPTNPDIQKVERVGSSEKLPSGNELVRTAQHLVMLVDEDGGTQSAVCDMKKTQLKVSRRWNTQMRMLQYKGKNGPFNPPMWATVWKLKTIQESNDKGSWFNFDVSKMEPSDVPLPAIEAAKALFDSFTKGEIQTSSVSSDEIDDSPESTDGDLPF